MPTVTLRPDATISNQIDDFNAGMTIHGILSDNNLKTRLRYTHADSVGNWLTRLGLSDYELKENERIKAVRWRVVFGSTIGAGFWVNSTSHATALNGVWYLDMVKRAFPTLTSTRLPWRTSSWFLKNPTGGVEWTEAAVNALEAWIRWRDDPIAVVHDTRLYELGLDLWILERPVTTGLSPAPGATTQNNNPTFTWNFYQRDNVWPDGWPVSRHVKVWTKAIVEDTVTLFDPETSPTVFSKLENSSELSMPWPKGVAELTYGGEYYWGVKAANKINGSVWWSDWSDPVPFKVNTPPVVDVVAPVTPVTNNKPKIEWTYTDAEGAPQDRSQVKVFEQPPAVVNMLRPEAATTDATSPVGFPVFSGGAYSKIGRTTEQPSLDSPYSLYLERAWTGLIGDIYFSTTSGGYKTGTNDPDEPPIVVPGETYTAICEFRAKTIARSCLVSIRWLDEYETQIAQTDGATVVNSTSGWTQAFATGVAPAGAKYVKIMPKVQAVPAGERHFTQRRGLNHGTSVVWTPGEGPTTGGGGWAGLNPDTDKPLWSSDMVSFWNVSTGGDDLYADMNTPYTVGISLKDNTTYRAYVRAAHKIADNPPYLYSDWDYLEFTTDFIEPPTPELTVSPGADRVTLNMRSVEPTGSQPTPSRFEIHRSLDQGETWDTFRYGSELISSFPGEEYPILEIVDYEPPFFKPVQYRAVSISTNLGIELMSLPSPAVEVEIGEHAVWVKNPADSSYNHRFMVTDGWLQFNRQRSRTVHQPMGRTKPLVVRGEADAITFNLGLIVINEADEQALEEMLALHQTLFIQTPRGSWYADVAGDISSQVGLFDKRSQLEEVQIVVIPFQEVSYVSS